VRKVYLNKSLFFCPNNFQHLTKEKVWYSPADLHPFFQWIDPIVCGWRSKMKAATAELNWTFSNDQECDDVCGSLLSVLQASSIYG
jgi:hypothetical protein